MVLLISNEVTANAMVPFFFFCMKLSILDLGKWSGKTKIWQNLFERVVIWSIWNYFLANQRFYDFKEQDINLFYT